MKTKKKKGGNLVAGGTPAGYFLPVGAGQFSRGRAGKQTGLGVTLFRLKQFYDNEKAPKAKRKTDDALAAELRAEFPHLKRDNATARAEHVNAQRSQYNRGDLTNGVVPETQSKRYDEFGNVVDYLPGGFFLLPETKRRYALDDDTEERAKEIATAVRRGTTVAEWRDHRKASEAEAASRLRQRSAETKARAEAKTAELRKKAAELDDRLKALTDGKKPVRVKVRKAPPPAAPPAKAKTKPAAKATAKPAAPKAPATKPKPAAPKKKGTAKKKPANPANPSRNPSRQDPEPASRPSDAPPVQTPE